LIRGERRKGDADKKNALTGKKIRFISRVGAKQAKAPVKGTSGRENALSSYIRHSSQETVKKD